MTRPRTGWWRRLGRSWLFLSAQTAWSVLAWVELSLTLVALVCSAIVFGAYVLRGLLAVDRATLRSAVRLARWQRSGGDVQPRPDRPVSNGHALVWLVSAAFALVPHLVSLILLPLAAWWGPQWATWTIRSARLGRPTAARSGPVGPRPADPVVPADQTGSPAWSGGHGLIGMRERVTSLGGSLTAGPTPDGGFEIWASLPLDQDRR
ncbi:MAG: hypothetical protein LBJ44_11430 [Propionibacteriaceae bacterium]|jgi:hypothetical protein|nr:hypothetical protein [Propionibacteriaceae bacterium]